MRRTYVDGLVSVIVPVYNSEKHLEETLKSVLCQGYKDIEIVLVDDCSKDNSVKIMMEMKKNHPEIIYYIQEKNKGAGEARNKALELAKGRYVAFLDSDDVWLPDKIQRQIDLMKRKRTPFSYTAIEMIDEDGNIKKSKRNIKEECDYNYLLHNTIIATSSVVIDRDVVGDFRMSSRRGGQDYATWLALLRNGIVACGINEVFVRYRVVHGSLSSNKFKSIQQVWEIQTQDENVNVFCAVKNVCFFICNAFKKHFM